MCKAIDQMRNQIVEANRKAENAMRETAYANRKAENAMREIAYVQQRAENAVRETAYANRKADAYEALLRKAGISEEEIEAATPDRKEFVS